MRFERVEPRDWRFDIVGAVGRMVAGIDSVATLVAST